jgi:hypothetical protein
MTADNVTAGLLAKAANDAALSDDVFRVLAAALTGQPFEWEQGDESVWTVCEGGCSRSLPADEAEHAQCGSLLVFCGDCLADHAGGCLACGAE